MNRRHLFLPLALALAGCPLDSNGDGTKDPNEVTSAGNAAIEAPASPTFVFSGTLIDAATRMPVGNQRVALNHGENTDVIASTVTDEAGSFTIAGATEGANLHIASEGYQTVNVSLWALIGQSPAGQLAFSGDLFPSDNVVFNVDQVYLAPANSTMSFTVVRTDGVPAANASVVVELPTLGAFGTAFGSDRRALTTDANGVVTLDRVPDVAAAHTLVTQGFFASVLVGPVDVNADQVYDYAGQYNTISYNRIGQWNGKLVVAVLEPVQYGVLSLVSGNVTRQDGDANAPSVAPSSPLIFVFNQPVDPASLSVVVSNDFPHRLSNGEFRYDDSTPEFGDETFPEPSFGGRSSNVLGGGSNTLTITLDPSRTIVTATPARAFGAGRQYVVSIAAASAAVANQTPQFLTPKLHAFYVAPPADGALAVESTYLERSASLNTYANAVVEFNQPVRGGLGRFDNVSRLYACIDADLNNDGDRVGAGGTKLDRGECPSAGYALTQTDVKDSLIVLVLRVGKDAKTARGVGRFYDINLGQDALQDATAPGLNLLAGVGSLPLKVLINPPVSTGLVAGDLSAALDVNGKLFPTAVLDATLNTASGLSRPASGGPALLTSGGALPNSTLTLPYGESVCNDGVDNDMDGTFDCDAVTPDSDCIAFCDTPVEACDAGETALVHQIYTDLVIATGETYSAQRGKSLPVQEGTRLGRTRLRYNLRSSQLNNWYSYIYTPDYGAYAYLNYFFAGPDSLNTRLNDGAATSIQAGASPRTGSFIPAFSAMASFTGRLASGTWYLYAYNPNLDPIFFDNIDAFVCLKL